MKHSILKKIVDLKKQKKEFAIVTDLKNSNSTVYKLDEDLDEDFIQYKDQIDSFFKSKNNGVIDGTDIFVETYIRPIKVVIVGAVHIAQYLSRFCKKFKF
jgi:xanthine dehydrogenase accessory factor